MKIILLKDVPKVGRKYDVKDVSEGYAANMLIPRGLAVPATASTLKKLAEEKEKNSAEQRIQDELLAKNLDTLKTLTLNMVQKANEKGHLFAGVTKEMLIEEIKKAARLNIDPDSIVLEKPIKETGEHKVTVEALGRKVQFTVVIEGKE